MLSTNFQNVVNNTHKSVLNSILSSNLSRTKKYNHTSVPIKPEDTVLFSKGDKYEFLYCTYPSSFLNLFKYFLPGGNIHKALKVTNKSNKSIIFGFYPKGGKGLRGTGEIRWPDPLCTKPQANSKLAKTNMWQEPIKTDKYGILTHSQAKLLNDYQINNDKIEKPAYQSSTGNKYYILPENIDYNIFGSFFNIFANPDILEVNLLPEYTQTDIDKACADTWGANCRSFWSAAGDFVPTIQKPKSRFNNKSRKSRRKSSVRKSRARKSRRKSQRKPRARKSRARKSRARKSRRKTR